MEAGWPGNRAGSVAETIFVMLLHVVRAPCQARQAGQRKRHAKSKYLFQHDRFKILSCYMHLFVLFLTICLLNAILFGFLFLVCMLVVSTQTGCRAGPFQWLLHECGTAHLPGQLGMVEPGWLDNRASSRSCNSTVRFCISLHCLPGQPVYRGSSVTGPARLHVIRALVFISNCFNTPCNSVV